MAESVIVPAAWLEGQHVAAVPEKDVHRRLIALGRTTADGRHDREPGHPTRDVACQAIRDALVEVRDAFGERHAAARPVYGAFPSAADSAIQAFA
jgi:hypothetical protein